MNEWNTKVRKDLQDLQIDDNLEKIKCLSKYSFKNFVRKKIEKERKTQRNGECSIYHI